MIRAEVVALGALIGLGYGLVAVGLVLCFRASRVLNLAHGQIGALGAVVFAIAVDRWDVPYWTALVPALLVGATAAATVELTVVRRLRQVPPVVTVVATLGVAQVLLFASGAIAGELTDSQWFPQPPGLPDAELGVLAITPAHVGLAVLGPLAVLALVLLLRSPVLGAALRASADNPAAARLLGIPAPHLALFAWGLAGALATLTVVFLLPAGVAPNTAVLGPSLLLRALAAAVIARMWRLPTALFAGIGIGIVEQLLLSHTDSGGLTDLALLALVMGALVARPGMVARLDSGGSWSAFERWSPLPAAARAVPLVRSIGPAFALSALVAAALVPLLAGAAIELRLAQVACVAIAAVSVWVLAGLGGMLSLGQFGVAGAGGLATLAIADATGSPIAGLVVAPLAGALVALAVIAPVLRAGGLGITVTTLALALAVERWLLQSTDIVGAGVEVEKIAIGPLDLGTTGGAYLMSVAGLVVVLLATRRFAAGVAGRRMVAARDNRPAAEALGVPVVRAQLQGTALAGALAGLAGGLLTQVLFRVTPGAFPVSLSIDAVAAALVGGLAVVAGPVAGALYIVGLPALVDLPSATLAATAVGWLLLLLYVPGGLAAVAGSMRIALAAALLRVAGHDPVVLRSGPRHAGSDNRPGRLPRSGSARGPATLELVRVSVHYGSVRAVDDVSVAFAPGSVTALVGPNGAGKTTLLDVAAGAARGSGTVRLGGEDVSRLGAAARARRGIARSFQDGRMFATLTVQECVRLALESPAASGRGAPALQDVIAALGLEPFAGARVRELSTGTRRLAELACLLALSPRVLLLDEPSAGLAEPEADALGPLLLRIRDELATTVVIVEHDLGLVERTAQRVVVMSAGVIRADGPPAQALAGAPA